MDYLKKISQQTSWQVLGKMVTSLSTILILGFITRNYGESGTGIFTLVLTYLAFFYLAADFGINAHVLNKMQGSKDGIQIELRKLLGLRLVWSLMLMVLSIIITPLLPFNNQLFSRAVLFGSIAIVGSSLFVTANAVFQSKLRYDLSVIASSSGTILALLVIIVMVLDGFPISHLVLGHMSGWILTGLVSIWLIRKITGNIWPIIDFSYIKTVFKESWPISLTLILNVVYFRVDSFILTSFKSFSDVGIYNLSYQIFQSILVLPTFIMNSYYPMMLNQFSNNINQFRSTLVKACFVMAAIAAFGTVVTLITSPFIINVLTGGKGFAGSAVSLQILSLSFPAYFVSAVLMWAVVVYKKYRQLVIVYLLGLMANIVLNMIFIPRFSYVAASFVTGISEYLILLMLIGILIRSWKK